MASARCDGCGRLMETGQGCGVSHLGARDRVRYGDEDEDWTGGSNAPCHDCNAVPGQHHHFGCDVARCRDCGGQEHRGPCEDPVDVT